jgi:3-oxoadipate enol-lactonase
MGHAGHLYYEEAGAGLPLVLIHGHTMDRRMWAAVAPRLARRYRLIMPDLAGHGKSGLTGAPQADDLAALLDHLGLEQAAVCGFSMGGGAAISFAIHHPGRYRLLIPVDAALNGYRFATWAGPKPYVQIARSQGLAAGLAAWLQDPLFAGGPDIAPLVQGYPGHAWLQGAWSPLPPGAPDAERLGAITAPTLVLVGERDLPDFQAIADLLAAAIPSARKQIIPGAGHLVPLAQPEAFADALEAFLEGSLA